MRIMVGFKSEEDGGVKNEGKNEDKKKIKKGHLGPPSSVSNLRGFRKLDYDSEYLNLNKPQKFEFMDEEEEEDLSISEKMMESEKSSGSGCGLEIIDRGLTRLFYWLGTQIGKHPSYYIIIPLFISLLLGTGMQRLIYVDDPEYLFSPVDGLGKFERELIESQFPMNYSSRFNPSRFVRPGRFARLFIEAIDNGTLLRTKIWNEIMELDRVVHAVSVDFDEETFSYDTICARWDEDCFENDVLELGNNGIMDKIESGNISLTYPVMLDPETFKTYAFPFFFGGVDISNVSTINSVKALQLNYFVAVNSPKQDKKGELWESAILDKLESLQGTYKYISVARFTVRTLATELERNTYSVFPYFSVTVVLMIFFTVGTCMMSDAVKSKPWLGIIGVISSNLGSLAAFGLVCYCGVEFIGINMAAPFLMLGIGIDDTFVMLASWRRTSPHDSVPKRMGECYSEAAVSITITSITDMLSFWVGVLTPFPCVQIFSVYSGAAVIATYLWHVFFFGGAIALSGYHEKDNRHSLLWWVESTPKSKSSHRSFFYRLFCSGGIDPLDPHNPKDNPDHGLMVFFRDYWAACLNNPLVKFLVLALFMGYLAVSCWGTTKIQEGLERRRMVLYDSYAVQFFDREDMYFREYPYRIQVVVSGELDYSDPSVQKSIEKLLSNLENSTFIRGKHEGANVGSLFTESWLRAFLGYVDRSQGLFDYNITTESDFISTLFEAYLDPSSPFYDDVKLNEDRTKIIASRFIVQTVNITNSNEERDMASELREIAASAPGLNVTVYHPFFIFFDQFLLIRTTSIQCVLIAAVIMMVVSLVFIPNLLCSLWVAFSIVSIELGVVGFMSLWGVNLDAISMINLIMCIGFSVDFSAHISYAYMSAKVTTPQERVRSCLYSLGLPIVQGALSTILGVLALLVAPSYIFITFFKVVFLVIVIAALHGLVLLPVLLSLFGPGSCGGGQEFDVGAEGQGGKDKVVPYSFVISPKGLDPKINGPLETYRRGSHYGQNLGLRDGQFMNGVPFIPRPSVTPKHGKNSKNPAQNSKFPRGVSAERDLGLGTSGEDESSESSLSKKNKKGGGSSNNLNLVKELYSNEGYLTDDEGAGDKFKKEKKNRRGSAPQGQNPAPHLPNYKIEKSKPSSKNSKNMSSDQSLNNYGRRRSLDEHPKSLPPIFHPKFP